MRRGLVAVLSVVALLTASREVLAQRTTGSIVGKVTDDSGGVLPGVSVSIKGEAIVGTQSTVSNETGFYRFAGLPPGSYTLTFSLAGFGTLNRQAIKVSVGGTLEENASLKVGAMSEEVTVLGESAVVDTTGNAVSTTYDKDWVQNAPVRRFTFFDLINAAPGVNQSTSTSSRSTSFGSSTDENSYQLDGTDFTAPLTGAAWPWPNTDAIEEIEVLSLGAPAEYGNLQGAVFNVVTRQGSNKWHGDANFYLQTDSLTSSNTEDLRNPDGTFVDACPDDDTKHCPYNRDKFNDLTVQISGPLVKDKLWVFGSYQYQRDYDSQPGTDPIAPARSDADRGFFKLNWQINEKNKLMFAIHNDYYRIPERATANIAPSAVNLEFGDNPSPNLTWTSILSERTYMEFRYSGFYGKDNYEPNEAGAQRIQPRFYDFDSSQITGGILYWYDTSKSEKTAFSGKVSHFADNFLGASHDFKFGLQYNSGGSDYVGGYNDIIYTYTYGGTLYNYGYTQLPFHRGGRMRALGAFFDDTVRANDRLSFNVGLRFDYSKARIPAYPLLNAQGEETGQQSAASDDLFTWKTVSPRLGFNLKLTGDGKTVMKGHYGRYYRAIVTGEYQGVGDSIQPRYYGVWDFGANRFDPGSLDVVSDNSNQSVNPELKNPYTDQFIVGFERELATNFGISLNYVYKKGNNYTGWNDVGGRYVGVPFADTAGTDPSGQTITVQKLVNSPADRQFVLNNPDELSSTYNGFTAQLTKRMSSHWQMTAALTLSKSEGRLASSGSSLTTSQFSSTLNTFGQNPNDFINTDGRLIGDRPVTFKVQFVYELPAGFLVGANYTHQSGRPYARQARVAGLGVATTILADPIDGERRVAKWNILDLRFQKEFSLGGDVNFALFMDGLNLLNDDANESVLSRLGTSDSFGVPSRFVLPRRLMVGAKFRF